MPLTDDPVKDTILALQWDSRSMLRNIAAKLRWSRSQDSFDPADCANWMRALQEQRVLDPLGNFAPASPPALAALAEIWAELVLGACRDPDYRNWLFSQGQFWAGHQQVIQRLDHFDDPQGRALQQQLAAARWLWNVQTAAHRSDPRFLQHLLDEDRDAELAAYRQAAIGDPGSRQQLQDLARSATGWQQEMLSDFLDKIADAPVPTGAVAPAPSRRASFSEEPSGGGQRPVTADELAAERMAGKAKRTYIGKLVEWAQECGCRDGNQELSRGIEQILDAEGLAWAVTNPDEFIVILGGRPAHVAVQVDWAQPAPQGPAPAAVREACQAAVHAQEIHDWIVTERADDVDNKQLGDACMAFGPGSTADEHRVATIERRLGPVRQYARTLNFYQPDGKTVDLPTAYHARREHAQLLSKTLDAVSQQVARTPISVAGVERYIDHCVEVARQRHVGQGMVAGAMGFGGSGLFGGTGAMIGAAAGGAKAAWAATGAAIGKTMGQAVGQLLSPVPVSYNIEAVRRAKVDFDKQHPLQAVRAVRGPDEERPLNAHRLRGFWAASASAFAAIPAGLSLGYPGNSTLKEVAKRTFEVSKWLGFCAPAWISAIGWGGYYWRQSKDPWLPIGPVTRIDPAQNEGRHFHMDRGTLETQFRTIYRRGPAAQAAGEIMCFGLGLSLPWRVAPRTWAALKKDTKARRANASYLRSIQSFPVGAATAVAVFAGGLAGDLAVSTVAYNMAHSALWPYGVLSDKSFCETRPGAAALPIAQPGADHASAAVAIPIGTPLEEVAAPGRMGTAGLHAANLTNLVFGPIPAGLHQASVGGTMLAHGFCMLAHGCRSETAPAPPPRPAHALAQPQPLASGLRQRPRAATVGAHDANFGLI